MSVSNHSATDKRYILIFVDLFPYIYQRLFCGLPDTFIQIVGQFIDRFFQAAAVIRPADKTVMYGLRRHFLLH